MQGTRVLGMETSLSAPRQVAATLTLPFDVVRLAPGRARSSGGCEEVRALAGVGQG